MSEDNIRDYTAPFGDKSIHAEVFLNRFIETLPVLLFVFQPESDKLLYVNKKFSQVLGYTNEDNCRGKNLLSELVKIDESPVDKNHFSPKEQSEWFNYKGNFTSKEGNAHRVDISGINIEHFIDTKTATILFMGNEISDPHFQPEINPLYKEALLKALNFTPQEATGKEKWSLLDNIFQSENHLRQYHETFVEAETFMHQGYWEIDIKEDRIFWSEGMYRLFGYSTAKDRESIHLSFETINLHLSPEEITRRDEEWNNILKDKHCYLREIEINTFDDRKKRLETFGKVHRNEAGEAVKVTGITREITKLREYESALQVKVNELSRSNKALEDFAFMASHDLQEPLRKLSNFGEKLHDSAKGVLTDENQNYLNRMLRATENMKHLIDSLLNFSLITQTEKKFEQVDLALVLKQVVNEQELKIEETQALITISSLPAIEAVTSQMKQLFNNLLHNALKFSSKGQQPKINITCQDLYPEEKEVQALSPDINYYKIIITDNGIGFEAKETEQIFKIFKRLHAKYEYSGSGIGLAICRKIVEYHHGIIYAEGNPGKGASFIIVLPETQLTHEHTHEQ
jgi:PAS domain S-box-containing protein